MELGILWRALKRRCNFQALLCLKLLIFQFCKTQNKCHLMLHLFGSQLLSHAMESNVREGGVVVDFNYQLDTALNFLGRMPVRDGLD